jgi:hypothetical protein
VSEYVKIELIFVNLLSLALNSDKSVLLVMSRGRDVRSAMRREGGAPELGPTAKATEGSPV